MKLAGMPSRAGKLVADNSPLILTALGVAGTITTAVLTYKGTCQAYEKLEEYDFALTGRNKFDVVWKLYIPAVTSGVLTISCIVCANRIGTRRAAALAAAYTVSERAYSEYKDKVIEKFGEAKEKDVQDAVLEDRIKKNQSLGLLVIEGPDTLCFDSWSGRYFKSTMENLKKAQNDINYQMINNVYASLTDFYEKIGLPRTDESDEVGWSSEEQLNLHFTSVITEAGQPALAFSFVVSPVRGYYKVH